MRVSKEKAADNRRRILEAATRLFRERGIEACGIDAITAEAGLTHGAFYSQFASKEAVAVEAIHLALDRSNQLWGSIIEREGGGERALERIAAKYLGRAHRDDPGDGCLIAALGGDLARQTPALRRAFTGRLEETLAMITGLLPERGAAPVHDEAIAGLSTMVGAVILARAVSDEKLSDRILSAAQKRVTKRPAKRKSAGSRPKA